MSATIELNEKIF